MPEKRKLSNAETREAIKQHVADVGELCQNLAALCDSSPDCVPALAWSQTHVRVEAIRAACFKLVDFLAMNGVETVEATGGYAARRRDK
jgi:hypothetical protein